MNPRLPAFSVALAAVCLCAACRSPRVSGSDPAMQPFIELMIPRRVEIQKYLTRPVALRDQRGGADSLEVILAAYDSFDHGVKTTGTFQFELYEQRMASGDKLGRRLAYWRVEVNDADAVMSHWDHLSRFFKFELAMPGDALPPGQYILEARLQTPTGEMLFDQYSFTHARDE